MPALEALFGAWLAALAVQQANAYHPGIWPSWLRLPILALGLVGAWMLASVALSYVPVVENSRIIQTSLSPGRIDVLVIATKTRACKWIRTDAYVTDQHGQLSEAMLSYPIELVRDNSRPVGNHNLGLHRVEFAQTVRPTSLQFEAVHSCGWMWRDTETTLGPYKVDTQGR